MEDEGDYGEGEEEEVDGPEGDEHDRPAGVRESVEPLQVHEQQSEREQDGWEGEPEQSLHKVVALNAPVRRPPDQRRLLLMCTSMREREGQPCT
jgi:hypothetical protein